MITVGVLVEGQTEEIMVRDFLGPALQPEGIHLVSTILQTKRRAGGPPGRGGVSKWAKIENDLRLRLASTPHWVAVTTLLDYYGLPADTPGMSNRPGGSAAQQVQHVERSMGEAVGHPRFLPNLVIHETEAWVFAAAEQLAYWIDDDAVGVELKKQADEAGGPELVNDGPTTAPSKRIQRLYPAYDKTQDGPVAVAELGLSLLRAACPHLDGRVTRLIGLVR